VFFLIFLLALIPGEPSVPALAGIQLMLILIQIRLPDPNPC